MVTEWRSALAGFAWMQIWGCLDIQITYTHTHTQYSLTHTCTVHVHFHLNSTGVVGNHGNGLRALSRIMERRECLQQDDCFLSPPQYMTVLKHPAVAPSLYMLLSYTYSPLCRWMNSHSLLRQHLHSNGADMSEMSAWCTTVDICSKPLTGAV